MKFKRKNKANTTHKKEANTFKSRKEIRKQHRKEKKAKKHAFFQRKKSISDKVLDVASFENKGSHAVSNTKQKSKLQQVESEEATKKVKVSLVEQQQKVKDRKRQQEARRKQQYQNTRVQQLKAANEEEDRVIKKLEKQLKLNKRKRKTVPKSFSSDGLDYLLEVCDEKGRQNAVSAEKKFLENSDSEFEEDLALVTGKVVERKESETLSETQSIDDFSEDSDYSERNLESEGNDSDNDAGQSMESCSDDPESDSDTDKDRNSVAFISKQYRKDEPSNSSVKLKKGKIKVVARHVDCQQNSEDDFANSVPVVSKSKKEKNTAVKSIGTEVDSRESCEIKESKLAKLKNNDQSKSGALVVGQKISKRSLISEGDINEYNVKHKKKKSNISKSETYDSTNVTNAPAGKDMVAKKKRVTFEDDELSDLSEDFEDEGVQSDSNKDVWEDIYGRTRDKKGNIVHVEAPGKYIPPHLRVQTGDADAKKQEQLLRLRKQLKGLLNRLAESNMNSIAVQIDELYMSNSRNDMNETLTQLVLESLIAPVLTPERLVMEQVMLVAILHANVGSEVGAHFMQVLVQKYDLLSNQWQEVEKKELDNVILTLSHLYNFRVFHCILMFDILEKLVEKFGEKEIELILIVLRSVGFSLRKDDPSALKDFILRVQHKASTDAHSNSSRVKFMLDVLLAIKNNNMSKIPNYDTSHSEHLKKLLKGFIRKGNYITELKISLDDLLKAEERGRWWVVGSAWTGVLPGEVQTEEPNNSSTSTQSTSQYSQQLLELAKKQRMNTDVRRNIFCILMTAEDYLDAFEKLLRLGLKNQQEREIIYVTLHCCLQEKKFNPYYGYLAQKLCDFDRKHQMTLQFTLWDRFKELQTFNQQQITNLAKLLTHLLLERGLPISVLKVVEFVNVNKKMVRFLRQTLLGVLLSPNEEASLQVFQRVAQSAKLRMFCESLRLFVHHFLLRNTTTLPEADAQLLTRRAKLADTLLSVSEHRLDLYQVH